MHDIGKVSTPDNILKKPGKLTKEEMAIMKSHTYHTYFVINAIGGLQQIAEWAAYHHEKLDGSGYPFHCSAGELGSVQNVLQKAGELEERSWHTGVKGKKDHPTPNNRRNMP